MVIVYHNYFTKEIAAYLKNKNDMRKMYSFKFKKVCFTISLFVYFKNIPHPH